MAKPTIQGAMTGRSAPSSDAMRRLRTASLWAATIAAINEAGLRNVLASTVLTVAAPVTATAFVYEVSAMRTAELARLAADHEVYMAGLDHAEPATLPSHRSMDKAPDGSAMIHKLDGMLNSRSAMLDMFGDDPQSVAPVYGRMIQQMLKDDETTFSSLSEGQDGRSGDVAAELSEKEGRLRAMHARLTKLAGA